MSSIAVVKSDVCVTAEAGSPQLGPAVTGQPIRALCFGHPPENMLRAPDLHLYNPSLHLSAEKKNPPWCGAELHRTMVRAERRACDGSSVRWVHRAHLRLIGLALTLRNMRCGSWGSRQQAGDVQFKENSKTAGTLKDGRRAGAPAQPLSQDTHSEGWEAAPEFQNKRLTKDN